MKPKSSGKFVIRLSPSLHGALREESKNLNSSLNEYCVSILTNRDSTNADNLYQSIVNELKSVFGDLILGILLFGSHARGDTNDNSDIDLLVIMKAQVEISRDLYRKAPKNIDEKVSLHFIHMTPNPQDASSILLECAIDGKILYDQTGSVSSQIEKIRSYILSGNVVRKVTHGQGYWIRQ